MRDRLGGAHFKSGRALGGAILVALAALGLTGLAREARAQDEQLSAAGSADHPIVIREHAGWNSDCEAIAHPALYLHEPPRHGSVCARVQDIKIRSMYVGTAAQCIGHEVRGVQLVYRPDAGFTGADGLRYAARYPSVLRTVDVTITVTADPPLAPRPLPSNMTAPATPERQPSGPVPACAELVF